MLLARSTGLATRGDLVALVEGVVGVEEAVPALWRREAIQDLEVVVSWLLGQLERGGITSPLMRNPAEAGLPKGRLSGRGFQGRSCGGERIC